MNDDVEHLKQLGSKETDYKYSNPGPNMLETFDNKYPDSDYTVKLDTVEFTSLCLGGNTFIDIATNENDYPCGVPIKDLVGTEGIVFSFDKDRNVPVAKQYHSVRKTKRNAMMVRIHFELFKGISSNRQKERKYIDVTLNHLVLVRRGWGVYNWVKAKKLKKDDQLVVDQRSSDFIRGKRRHRLVAEEIVGRSLSKEEIPHHADLCHNNNTPSNIEVLPNNREHTKLHRLIQYGWEDSLDISKLVAEYNKGENIHSLAKKYGCDYSTIESRIGHLVEKRSQSASLNLKHKTRMDSCTEECRKYYEQGYDIYTLANYYNVHPTTISSWVKRAGGEIRESNQSRLLKLERNLLPLNHKVKFIEFIGKADVYNMEVEDTECFFANGIVVHNCPKTGQPDFAKITVEYTPAKLCLETKSFKLYMFAYRNHRSFMETITNKIRQDLVIILQPVYLEVHSEFNPRGGIHLDVLTKYQRPPM